MFLLSIIYNGERRSMKMEVGRKRRELGRKFEGRTRIIGGIVKKSFTKRS